MEFILIWIIFGVLAASIASGKGASGFVWFIWGVLFGPFALIAAFMITPKDVYDRAQAVATGKGGAYKKCPFCAEAIRKEAIICRFCSSELPEAEEEEVAENVHEAEEKPVNKELKKSDAYILIALAVITMAAIVYAVTS